MGTRVYQYGLLPPTEAADRVREQILLGHRFRNLLTEIECHRRNAFRECYRTALPRLVDLEAAWYAADADVKRVNDQIRELRVLSRKRVEVPEELQAELDAARKERTRIAKEFSAGVREARELPFVKAEEARMWKVTVICEKWASKHSGVWWGTKGMHQKAADDSRKSMPLYDNGPVPNNPRFRRWDGTGCVGAQIMKGCSLETLLKGTRLARLAPVDPLAWDSKSRGERRRLCRTSIRLRVASSKRDPVFATWPMLWHRPLPDGVRIKRIDVSLNRFGPTEQWMLDITVDEPVSATARVAESPRTARSGVVAIDIGWRKRGNRLRFGAWQDSHGRSGEWTIGPEIVERINHADALHKQRQLNFNAARLALIEDLKTLDVPEELRKRTGLDTIHLWKSPERLAKFVHVWGERVRRFPDKPDLYARTQTFPDQPELYATPRTRMSDELRWTRPLGWKEADAHLWTWKNRFAGDEKAFAAAEKWRYHEFHLWEWESRERRRVLLRRREFYRIVAKQIVTTYETVVVEKFRLTKFVKRAEIDETESYKDVRRQRYLVALSEFRGALKNAVFAAGCAWKEKNPAFTTRDCNACGNRETFDAARELTHACSKCETVWDQDDNAAANLLDRYKKDNGQEFLEQSPSAVTRGSRRFKPKAPKTENKDAAGT